MKRDQATELNNCLNAQGLKVKFLNGEQTVKLLYLKRPLAKYVTEMAEEEQQLFEMHGATVINGALQADVYNELLKDKAFCEKLKAIRKKEFNPKELHFLNSEEFNKFIQEVDISVAAVLADYLLKEEPKE